MSRLCPDHLQESSDTRKYKLIGKECTKREVFLFFKICLTKYRGYSIKMKHPKFVSLLLHRCARRPLKSLKLFIFVVNDYDFYIFDAIFAFKI